MNPLEQAAAWRTIDANFNRAVEGLRVVEDHARFALNDRFLAERCKTLRHDLAQAMKSLDANGQRVLSRDTLGDVGTHVKTAQEFQRDDLGTIVGANWQRASQALRVIEEFAKLLGHNAADFESLRYRTYTYAKAFATNERSQSVWEGRRLYVLIDGGDSEAAFRTTARELIAAGIDVLQLRDKRLDDRRLLERAHALRQLINELPTDQRRPLFIINDRPDIALLAHADGVHIGQEELPVAEVRRLVGANLQIGVSTHNLEQAREAILAGADYLGCGPTFPSGTKSFAEFPGLAFLREVAAEISLPCFAIGGISATNLGEVQAAGITRVAVSKAVLLAADRQQAVRELQTRLTSQT